MILPSGELIPGQLFTVTGQIFQPRQQQAGAATDLSPELLSSMQINVLWQAAGLTIPISKGSAQINGNGSFSVQGVIPSLLNGDAVGGGTAGSKVGLVLQTQDSGPLMFLSPFGLGDPPPFQVKVVDSNGNPIQNAIVKTFSSAHESSSATNSATGQSQIFNLGDLYNQPSQLMPVLGGMMGGGDPFNCQNTAVYGRTDVNGLFNAQFDPEILAMAGKKVSLGFVNGGKEAFTQFPDVIKFDLVVNATYQGYTKSGSSKPQAYILPIEYRASTKHFYDGTSGKLLNTVPVLVILAKLPAGTAVELPVQVEARGMPVQGSFENFLGTGIPLKAFGSFVSFASKSDFPDAIFHTLTPIRVQFQHDATKYGGIQSAVLKLDGQSYPFVKGGNPNVGDCEAPSLYVADIPNSHRLAKGSHMGLVEVKDLSGATTKRYIQLNLVDPPGWVRKGSLQNRGINILSWDTGYLVQMDADNLPKNDPGSRSTLGANVPKIGPLDNAAGAHSHLHQDIKANGATNLIHTGAFQAQALNTQAGDIGFSGNQNQASGLQLQPLMLGPVAADSGPASFDIPKKTISILDSGKIPLFRYVWGVWPIASATVGADMWFNASLTYEGHVSIDPASGSVNSSLLSNPAATVAVDAFFDLSALFGLVSANAHAIPQITVSMPVAFVNGSKQEDDICFRYRLDIEWSARVGVCVDTPFGSTCIKESGTKNIFNDYTPKSTICAAAQVKLAPAAAATPPPAANPALANDGFGHTLAVWRTEQGDIQGTLSVGNSQQPAVQISGNHASIDPAVAFFGPNQAVAVWAQSGLTAQQAATANLTDTVKAQHMAYSVWNGSSWSAPQTLTSPTTGEGGVVLAGCMSTNPACPAGGQVTAVWVKDVAGALAQHQLRLYQSTFNGVSWAAPAAVDPGSSSMDASPTAAYRSGIAVVGWVRDDDRVPGTIADRHFAYREMNSSTVFVPSDLPTGMAEPSLAVGSGGKLRLAFTVAEDPQAMVGNQRTLYTAVQSCGRTCSWSYQAIADSHGRDIHAEGPVLTFNNQNQGIVIYRALGFGPVPGGAVVHFPEDSLGTVMGTGDMAQLQVDFMTSSHNPTYLTNDGKVNWQVAAAFDPMMNVVKSAAVQGSAPTVPLALLPPNVLTAGVRQQRLTAAVGDQPVLLVTMPQGPEFAIAALASESPIMAVGQNFLVTATVINLGSDWAASGPLLDVVAHWDGGPGYGSAAGAAQIAELPGGIPQEMVLDITPPADPELPHELVVTINPAFSPIEADAGNNQMRLNFGGLTAPGAITPALKNGSSLIFLSWDAVVDDRVVGYRIYRSHNGGEMVAIGSSSLPSFVDLTAAFDQQYSYAVASYSINGAESALGPWQPLTPEARRAYLPIVISQ